jgi:Mn2+/Fe2+ NRAMP family transporter
LALELASGFNYLAWIPLVALMVWFTMWRVKFSIMEKVYGLLGLALLVTVVAVFRLHDFHTLAREATNLQRPSTEDWPTYFYFAIALFGAAMTPYEVFFFSSGAVEEGWTRKDLMVNRANVYIGFPLGGVLSLAIMGGAALLLAPRGITVDHLSQAALPVTFVLGKLGLAILIFGVGVAFFGAALETGLSSGYIVSQFFGWQWGKFVKPAAAPRFHLVVLLSVIFAAALGMTTVDPIKVTEYSIVLSAAALPLTYFPILVIANDPEYMGDKTNSRFTNGLGVVYLVILCAIAVATIPLMIVTKAGA